MTAPIFIPTVNEEDEIIGFGEKLEVHQKGLLHRAFSILVFNKNKQLLVHQRAIDKYHCGGLWTNTCCGHPNIDETMLDAVHRRLPEEMGFDCDLEFKFKFKYKAVFENGLIENEIDHVYVGQYNDSFTANTVEVADYKWQSIEDLKIEISENPEKFTVWFKEIMLRETEFGL
jgi:isopentenyl-diphosphate Delta-isomerase